MSNSDRTALVPHHDGSELYVPQHRFQLGETVPVRLRVPRDAGYDRVVLRSVADGEIRPVPATMVETTDQERWYEAPLLLHNPVTRYRFLLLKPGGGFDWLNGTGVWSYDVTDTFDFTLTTYGAVPAWSRAGVVYQIFPDRFARSAGADDRPIPAWARPTPWGRTPSSGGDAARRELYGGDLAGIEEHLDHLVDLGVSVIYLTPIFPAQSAHRYDASTFDRIDPLLGGDGALSSLTAAAHERGIRIVGDLTTNHTGDSHQWFARSGSDPGPDSPTDTYSPTDTDSRIDAGTAAGTGTGDTRDDFYLWRAPGDYVSWLGVPSLPKLDWASTALRRRFVDGEDSVVGQWLREPYNLDGWRIDVANMTGRYREQDFAHDVARTVRATVESVRPDAVLVAEHMHDPTEDLRGDGWQSAMNYAGFTRPVWNWLCAADNTINYLGLPTTIPRRGGADIVRSIREFGAQLPWQVAAGQWNNLGSHDTARLLTLLGDEDLVEVAAGLLMTYLGTPMIFAGDEWGATGTTGEQGRTTMPWSDRSQQNSRLYSSYRSLIQLRNNHRVLRDGGLRWVLQDDDALAFLRETGDDTLLVFAARGPWSGAALPPLPGFDEPQTVYGTAALVGDGPGPYRLPATDGPAFSVWRGSRRAG